MESESGEAYIPEGYTIEEGGMTVSGHPADKLVNPETGEWFFLTNRRFKEINHTFANLPARAIQKLKQTRGENEPINILDVGGGIDAQAAEDIVDKYQDPEDQRIQVFSIDITARKNDKPGVHQIVGNMLALPLKDECMDMAYSRQSIVIIDENSPGEDVVGQAVKETARTLKPGGLFFIDKEFTEDIAKEDIEKLKELSADLNVVMYSKEAGLFLRPLDRIKGLITPHSRFKFLIIVKNPVNKELLKALKLDESNMV